MWLVRIDFLDHAQHTGGSAEPVKCTLFGLLYRETKAAYYLSTWVSDNEINGENSDTYVIIKHRGVRLTKIRKEAIQ